MDVFCLHEIYTKIYDSFIIYLLTSHRWTIGSIVRPAELHSPSAEENCMTENVASLRSVKVATPPCAAKAAIPCGLAVRKQHEMLFAASK